MFRALLAVLFCSAAACASAQGPRSWQDHISINYCNSVTKLGSKIYGSNYNGIIYFDEKDFEDILKKEKTPKRLNKINGLSDVGIRVLRANPYNDRLLVIYDNSNIDVIDINGTVTNYPDFKLKTMSAKKIINEVTFDRQYAYLACGFGIVLFDTEKLEIKETYFIGEAGGNIDVHQVAVTDTQLFAATAVGMKSCRYKALSPNNFRNWKSDTLNVPQGPYNGVLNVDGKVICSYSHFLKTEEKGRDTFFVYNTAGQLVKYAPLAEHGHTTLRMGPVQGKLFGVLNLHGIIVRDVHTGVNINYVSTFNGEVDYGTVRDAYFGLDHTKNYSYWTADSRFGLHQTYGYYPFYPQAKVEVNGTNRNFVSMIDLYDGIVGVAPASIDETGFAHYMTEGINVMKDNQWSYMRVINPSDNQPALDVTSVLIDRKDKTRVWASSNDNGIFEFVNGKLTATYNAADGVPELIYYDQGVEKGRETRSQGLTQDNAGNIWFANSEQKKLLSVLKVNRINNKREYKSFEFENGPFTRKVFVDRNNLVWMLHQREGGITVFRHGNFSNPVPEFNYKKLTNEVGKGNLQSNSVYAIAEDKDGKIWIGTKKGISVFYNPAAIFTSGNYDSQPIKIVQDGNVELLLGDETVTSIVVDGANNKWVGTFTGGVYCFSPDGIRQLYHFTANNSPLYSDFIIDLKYDEATGDVYIGTELGLQSFRSTIVEGAEDYTNAYAFPNPVKPGYAGTVLVRGLLDNSIVKITDSAGNMVWETKSTGGQIEWPVTNLGGERVTTGVYLVYASTADGGVKTVTKVLVVN
jgi:hypothetical protein